jgi:hypothetical protein
LQAGLRRGWGRNKILSGIDGVVVGMFVLGVERYEVVRGRWRRGGGVGKPFEDG